MVKIGLSTILLLFLLACNRGGQEEKKTKTAEPSVNIDSLNIPIKNKAFKNYFDSLHLHQSFNGNVLIAQEGIIVYADSFGMANFVTKDSLRLNHSFQLASVSKQFTAVAILQLVEKGKISLDDSVQVVIPEFPYHGISIHMLLCHRSGLPNYTYFIDKIVEDKETIVSNSQVLDSLIALHPEWYYPPDITFEYSNTGYMLLATIVEKLSNMKFYDYVKQNIFDKVGMKRSFFNIYTLDTVGIATGHLYGTKQARNNLIDGVYGDKGIYSSVYDLFLWDKALYSGKILKTETLELAFQNHGESNDIENYGYGWRLRKTEDGLKVIYHGGWWRGFQNLFVRVPEKKWTIIVLSNRKTHNYINMIELFEILLK